MAVVDSRVRQGVLTLTATGSAAETFSCQITAVSIVPSTSEGDSLEVLCGDKISTAAAVQDTLNFTIISDWSSATGIQRFSWAHRGETVGFEVQFDGNALDKWSGTALDQAITVGGAVGEQQTQDVSWPIVSLKPPAAFGDGQLHPDRMVVVAPTGLGTKAGNQYPFTPTGATLPADLTALKGDAVVGDSGSAMTGKQAFTTGDYVVLGDGSKAHWTGTNWVTGAA